MARISRLVGVLMGLSLLALFLLAWRILLDEAEWFAPALALIWLLLWALASARGMTKRPALRRALNTAAWVSLALSIVAALSLGSFLPGSVAAWISPPLARFGGQFALAVVAAGLLISVLLRWTERTGPALDTAAACTLGSLWVGSQVERQATFPPPPTSATLLAPRLDLLFAAAAALGLLALVAVVLGSSRGEPIRIPEANTTIARGPSPLVTHVGPWLWRWAVLLSAFGLLVSLAVRAERWYWLALLLAVLLVGRLFATLRRGRGYATSGTILNRRRAALVSLRGGGWLLLWLLALTLIYAATAEDLEAVMLRNTAEYRTQQFWRGLAGDDRFASAPTGSISGTVLATDGQPLPGASVVVATVGGQAFTTRSGEGGRYMLDGVPRGNYLPMSVAPGHRESAPGNAGGRVVTVRPGQTTGGVDFRLPRTQPISLTPDDNLTLGPPTTSSVDYPRPSQAVRREFTFSNAGMALGGGIVHEPAVERGPGPFPILLIVYPGEARAWEGVSIPLAASSYVVVSYFPVRLLDLNGDVDDLRVLLGSVAAGRLSERGDPNSITLVGGSVSTVYTYLMARALEGGPAQEQLKATIKYGGLFDFFRYRQDWEQGKITIDPGISELEYLLVAFGRPDTRPELYLRLSPRYSLGPETLPPTLLVHTGNDVIVPVEQSHIADQTLGQLGTTKRLLIYENLEHYLDVTTRDPAQIDMLNQTLAFLGQYAADGR